MSLFRFTVHNDTCHCEGVKRPSQSTLSLQVVRCNLKILMRLLRRKMLLVMTVNFARFLHFLKCSNIMKRCAFTLAEVLITLGIIGVVAAMTLPVVINNHREQVTVAKAKKIYSIINQAFLLSVNDNGPADEWTVGNSASQLTATQFASYFTPYLKISKDCGTNSGCIGYTQKMMFLNGNITNMNYDTDNRYYKIILSDGSYIWIRATYTGYNYCNAPEGGHNNVCGVIFFDVNGSKVPNTLGIDIFNMLIKANQVSPVIGDCNKENTGSGCLNYILQNGNMKYLH